MFQKRIAKRIWLAAGLLLAPSTAIAQSDWTEYYYRAETNTRFYYSPSSVLRYGGIVSVKQYNTQPDPEGRTLVFEFEFDCARRSSRPFRVEYYGYQSGAYISSLDFPQTAQFAEASPDSPAGRLLARVCTASSGTATRTSTWEPDVTFSFTIGDPGYSSSHASATPEQCRDSCLGEPRCRFWYQSGRQCYLSENIAGRARGSGFVAGEIQTAATPPNSGSDEIVLRLDNGKTVTIFRHTILRDDRGFMHFKIFTFMGDAEYAVDCPRQAWFTKAQGHDQWSPSELLDNAFFRLVCG